MPEPMTDVVTLTDVERDALMQPLRMSGLSGEGHRRVFTAVGSIITARLAAVESFAAENETWVSQAPRGPGNASYINGFENGRRGLAKELRDLLAATIEAPPNPPEQHGSGEQ